MESLDLIFRASYAFNARLKIVDFKLGSSFSFVMLANSYFVFIFRWGRWEDIMINSGVRKGFTKKTVEEACRMIILYCINTYRGDEKIKSFIWDLITPEEFGGGDKVGRNHAGVSGPVPRGRKGKKIKSSSKEGAPTESIAWVSDEKYDMEMYLDKSYRKHLDRHGTKLLLRIRMLYYLQNDILREHMKNILTPGFNQK